MNKKKPDLELSIDALEAEAQDREDRVQEVVGSPLSKLDPSIVARAFQDGLIVQAHFSWWRGQGALRPEDLGMRPSKEVREFLKEAVNLGNKRLLPREYTSRYKSLEVKGRTALSALSFSSVWGYFVPLTTYGIWKAQFAEIKKEWDALTEQLIANHANVVMDVRAMWIVNAPRLFKMANGRRKMPDDWAETSAEAVVSQIKGVDEIRERFHCSQNVWLVPIPSEGHIDRMKADRADRIKRLGQDRAALVHEFESDIEAEFSKKLAVTTSFVDGIQAQIRETICKLAVEVHNTVAGKKSVTERTASKLRRLVEEARALNFVNDPSSDEWLDKIEAQLEEQTPSEGDEGEDYADALSGVLASVAKEARMGIEEARRADPSFSLVLKLDRKSGKK